MEDNKDVQLLKKERNIDKKDYNSRSKNHLKETSSRKNYAIRENTKKQY